MDVVAAVVAAVVVSVVPSFDVFAVMFDVWFDIVAVMFDVSFDVVTVMFDVVVTVVSDVVIVVFDVVVAFIAACSAFCLLTLILSSSIISSSPGSGTALWQHCPNVSSNKT